MVDGIVPPMPEPLIKLPGEGGQAETRREEGEDDRRPEPQVGCTALGALHCSFLASDAPLYGRMPVTCIRPLACNKHVTAVVPLGRGRDTAGD